MPRRSEGRQSHGGTRSRVESLPGSGTQSPTASPSHQGSPSFSDDVSASGIPMSEDTVRRATNDIVRLLLFCEHDRLTVRQAKLADNVLEATTPNRTRVVREAFGRTQQILTSKFGLKVSFGMPKTLPAHLQDVSAERVGNKKRKKESADAKEEKSDIIFVTSTLPPAYRAVIGAPDSEYEQIYMGYVFTIVAIVLLNNGSVTSSELFVDFLPKALGLPGEDSGRCMTAIGNVESIVARMVKQRYLIKERFRDSENRAYVRYFAGPRAKAEFTADGIAEIFDKLLDGTMARDRLKADVDRKLASGATVLAVDPSQTASEVPTANDETQDQPEARES